MSMLKTLVAAAAGAVTLMLALTSPSTHAQQGGRGLAACRTDLATFCAGFEAGSGKRMKCLVENQTKLQPACLAVVQTRIDQRADRKAAAAAGPASAAGAAPPLSPGAGAQPAPQAQSQSAPQARSQSAAEPPSAGAPERGRALAACRADVQTLCAGIQPAGGARMKCLLDNRAKLSPACDEAVQARQSTGKAARAALRGACRADAQSLCAADKGPARRQCLTTNVTKLSPDCAAALQAKRG